MTSAWKAIQCMPESEFSSNYLFMGMVSQSPKMREVWELLHKITSSNAPAIIEGESGVGKELIAHTIHALGKRKDGPFIPVDCGALPATLMESELFGYEKGAFTGASQSKAGLLEYAEGGTFFMDELTNLDMSLQSKLLRVLQERRFRRLGGAELNPFNARVVAATNDDPKRAIDEKFLRLDLYYRLSTVTIRIPPLRQRLEDIPLLARHFSAAFAKKENVRFKHFSNDAFHLLLSYDWPGNVRELKNVVERLQLLGENDQISAEEIYKFSQLPLRSDNHFRARDFIYNEKRKKSIDQFEEKYIRRLMRVSGNNISRAAKISLLSRPTIYRLIKKHAPLENKTMTSA